MNYQESFQKRGEIDSKKIKLLKEIEGLNQEQKLLFQECKHEIVFQLHDNFPRKKATNVTYFCPACGLIQNSFHVNTFQNSRIISLSHLSLIGTIEVLQKIREEVFQNMDFYYRSNMKKEILSEKMEEVLFPYQKSYTVDKIKKYTKGKGFYESN